MRRDPIDFHAVLPEHIAIHERLMNWARWVKPGRGGMRVHPMFKGYRHGNEEPGAYPVNSLDGHAVEKLVVALPDKQRTAIQWSYVFWRVPVHIARKATGETEPGLIALIHSGRTMLKNRA